MSRAPSAEEARRSTEAAAAASRPKPPPRRLILTPASAIDIEPVVWAWEDESSGDSYGRIPAGSFGLFAGREGTGKSSFLIWLAAKLTRGELLGAYKGDPRPVIYVAVEDSWKFTIAPRLLAAGADLDLVYRADVKTDEEQTVTLCLPTDNSLLEQAINEHGVALVALDPLMSAISDHLDTHVNRQVRQALDPLVALADRTGAILGGIAHFNKSAGTDASALITASGAFKDVARFIFAFARAEDGTQVITQTKNSLGRSDLPSLNYDIITATVPTKKGNAEVGRLVMRGIADRTVQDILSAQVGDENNEKTRTRAVDFLKNALAGGPRRSKEIEEEARERYQISERTLNRARKDLSLPAAKRASGPVGPDGKRKPEWWTALAEHEGDLNEEYTPPEGETLSPAKGAKGAKTASPDTLGTLGTLAQPKSVRHRGRSRTRPPSTEGNVVPFRPDAGQPTDDPETPA